MRSKGVLVSIFPTLNDIVERIRADRRLHRRNIILREIVKELNSWDHPRKESNPVTSKQTREVEEYVQRNRHIELGTRGGGVKL